jgi:hypothetical protein
MSKKVVVLQSNYIPWKGYFELIHQANVFCFYDEVQYTKNDWRNRNRILGPNGMFWITVPVEKEAVNGKISEAQITKAAWQKKHFRTIEQTYSKSVNKNDVLTILEPIYLGKEWTSISQLNQHLIITIARYMGISTEFKNSTDFDLKGDRVNRLINLINQLEGTQYISGPAAKNYLTENELQFEQHHIQLMYKEYGPYLPYDNKKKQFEDYVSVLDLLMNVNRDEYMPHLISSRVKS